MHLNYTCILITHIHTHICVLIYLQESNPALPFAGRLVGLLEQRELEEVGAVVGQLADMLEESEGHREERGLIHAAGLVCY
ncbi:hypothetical protein EON65_49655 [archaeon]|nr:MAG: hypothetical protein EON65_49655 [archaeon]